MNILKEFLGLYWGAALVAASIVLLVVIAGVIYLIYDWVVRTFVEKK